MSLYEYGLWIAVFVLSVKTAFLLGISGMNKKLSFLFSLFFGLLLGMMLIIFSDFQDLLAYLLEEYTFFGALAVAVLLIYLGLREPKKDNCLEGGITGLHHWRRYIIALLPCPFCLLALAFAVITVSAIEEVELGMIGLKVTFSFIVMVWLISLLIRKISLRLNINRVFNQVLVLLGIVTLVFSFTVPNVAWIMQSSSFSPFVLEDPCWVAIIVFLIAVSILTGYFYQKKKTG